MGVSVLRGQGVGLPTVKVSFWPGVRTERELLELLNMERSTFYDRKKEAIMLLGVSLWGYAIPQFKGIIQTDEFGKDETILDYFLR